MTFPTVGSTGTVYTTAGTNATDHVIDLPASIAAGNLLICLFSADGNGAATWPLGWEQIYIADSPSSSHVEARYHIADGSEGADITVSEMIWPRVEPEIAFQLKADLKGPGVTAEQGKDLVESFKGR